MLEAPIESKEAAAALDLSAACLQHHKTPTQKGARRDLSVVRRGTDLLLGGTSKKAAKAPSNVLPIAPIDVGALPVYSLPSSCPQQ